MELTIDDTVVFVGAIRNDVHAPELVDHVLVPGARYIVAPIRGNKAPKFRDRTCTFIKGRRFNGGQAKAKVQFEDDLSIGHVDPNDLLPLKD